MLLKDKKKRIRQSIKKEIKVSLRDKSQLWSLVHSVDLIADRKDKVSVEQLIHLCRIHRENKNFGVKEFYWFIKDYPMSARDIFIYKAYDEVCEKLELKQVDPKHFSNRGGELYKRIKEWRGEGGNTIKSIAKEFFEITIKEVIDFNRVIVSSPKSLMGDYGWGMWEMYIKKNYKGKIHYLRASKKDKEQVTGDRVFLRAIQKKRDEALVDGNVELYDRIGMALTDKPIKEVYDVFCS